MSARDHRRSLPKVAAAGGLAVVTASVSISIGLFSCGARTGLDVAPPGPECYVDSDCPGFRNLCLPVACVPLGSVLRDAGSGSAGNARYPTTELDGGPCGVVGPCGAELSDPDPDAGAADAGASTVAAQQKRAGTCVSLPPVNCDDGNACTVDACNPATASCSHTWATRDRDHDGYYGPLPGTTAGAPGSCGNDCNDTDPTVHPGATDTCGVDNDCDNDATLDSTWLPAGVTPVRVSGDIAPVDVGGLAFDGTSYAAAYTGKTTGFNVYMSLLSQSGQKLVPPGEEVVTLVDADASGGPIAWIGDRYGLTWQDRRDGNYEIYFNVFDAAGQKGLPDVQLTNAMGFSVNPAIGWNGAQFIVTWQDDRDGVFNLYGQVVSADGELVGGNVALTDSKPLGSESPAVATGKTTMGFASNLGDAMTHLIQFQAYAPDLSAALMPSIALTDGTSAPVYPTLAWAKDRYVIAWYDRTATPSAIYAAAVAEDGTVLVPPQPVTHPGAFHSRYPFLRASADRVVLAFSDDRDQTPAGYQLYMVNLLNDLTPIGAEMRVTFGAGQDTYPMLSFGPSAAGGILYRSDDPSANFEHDAWFTGIKCVVGGGGGAGGGM